jgi:hypothetical protein
MLSKFLKIIMVITSVSPVFFTLWFNDFSNQWKIKDGLIWLVISFALIIIAYLILQLSLKKLERIPIQISSIATADKEVLAFIFAYLLPLLDINHKMLAFVLVLFAFVAFTTHIYHFNPIFGLFGYHFFEVTTTNGVSYVLMSKRQIRNLNQVTEVILVSDYILIDVQQ